MTSPARWLIVCCCFALLATAACNRKAGLVVDAPLTGAFTTDATTTVSGRITRYTPQSHSLTLDGVPVVVASDGTYNTTLSMDASKVFTVAELDLTNGNGDLIDREILIVGHGEVDPIGALVPEALQARVSQSGLQDVVSDVFLTAAGLDDGEPFASGTELIDSVCVPHPLFPAAFPCWFDLNISVTSSSFESLSATVTSVADALDLAFSVDGLAISLHAFHNPNPNVLCDLDLAGSVAASGQVALSPAADPRFLDTTVLSVDVSLPSELTWSVSNGLCDSTLLLDTTWIEDLLGGEIEPFVETQLDTLLADPDGAGPEVSPLEPLLDGELATLELAAPIEGLLSTKVGLAVDLGYEFEHVTESDDGLDAGVALSVEVETVGADAPDLTEVASVAGPAPVFGTTTPEGGLPYHAAVSVSPDAINQALAALTESGLVRLAVTEVPFLGSTLPIDGALLALILDPIFADVTLGLAAEAFEIRVNPKLAPVVSGEAGPTGEPLDLNVAGLDVRFVQVSTGTRWLSLSIDGRVGLDVDFDTATGTFLPVVSELELGVSVATNEIGANITTVPIVADLIVQNIVLPPVLETIEAGFPTLTFAGHQLTLLEAVREGTFLSAYVDLTPVAP